MIHVIAPQGFEPEKKYIIDLIFNNFLGLQTLITFEKCTAYTIQTNSGFNLQIADSFFSQFTENESYLFKKNIPDTVIYGQFGELMPEHDLPFFWGNNSFSETQNQLKIGADIFASAFFLLSRWEEAVIETRDIHNRFPDTLNSMQRFGLQYRPIVNEYVELLRNVLTKSGISGFKINQFQLQLSCDVDYFLSYPSFGRFVKRLGGSLLKRHSFSEFFNSIREYIGIKFLGKQDPYDTFNRLMDFAETKNTTVQFNFIPGKIGEADADYNIDNKHVKAKIAQIVKRGHHVGIHGSYDSYENPAQFSRELQRLKKIHPNISSGRQHFLRFDVPLTWRIWDENNLQSDSTLGFSNDAGFRCGVCKPYKVFDIYERTTLNLLETPLIWMDTAMRNNRFTPNEQIAIFNKVFFAVQKYKGTFAILIHNNSLQFVPEQLKNIATFSNITCTDNYVSNKL